LKMKEIFSQRGKSYATNAAYELIPPKKIHCLNNCICHFEVTVLYKQVERMIDFLVAHLLFHPTAVG